MRGVRESAARLLSGLARTPTKPSTRYRDNRSSNGMRPLNVPF